MAYNFKGSIINATTNMTINQGLNLAVEKLNKNRIKSAILDAELLLSFCLKKNRSFIISHPELELKKPVYKKFIRLINKRANDWSVACLIGEKEFYGLNFKVDKNVLVPRSETELIIDEIINNYNTSGTNYIDIGTGSGAIIITLAINLKKPKQTFTAIDISSKALKIARQNYKNNKTNNINFIKGDLLKPLLSKLKSSNNPIIITANLPYLTNIQIKNSPSIKKEPRLALYGGSDGLKYYRQLFTQIKSLQQKNIVILNEIDPSQKNSLIKIAKDFFPSTLIKTKTDLAQQDRLVIVEI